MIILVIKYLFLTNHRYRRACKREQKWLRVCSQISIVMFTEIECRPHTHLHFPIPYHFLWNWHAAIFHERVRRKYSQIQKNLELVDIVISYVLLITFR